MSNGIDIVARFELRDVGKHEVSDREDVAKLLSIADEEIYYDSLVKEGYCRFGASGDYGVGIFGDKCYVDYFLYTNSIDKLDNIDIESDDILSVREYLNNVFNKLSEFFEVGDMKIKVVQYETGSLGAEEVE